MDFNFLNKNEVPNKGKKGKKESKFSSSIVGAVIVFILITALYLVINGGVLESAPEISISDLAKNMNDGNVKKIVVAGEGLSVTYANGEVKTAKKETESSLSQTLFNYGVKP